MRVTIGAAACGRAGSIEGAVGAAVASVAEGRGTDATVAGVVFGTMLREIGRGLGSGTFLGADWASIENPLIPMLNASVAVDARNRAAMWVTRLMGWLLCNHCPR
ncbi:hypothetical protein SR870_04520 [Rhodopseudomonas palustris]|uniref:hypothetical protein n=1 Tax=Rhodopseudomonas palustris TaxID=1076 RepID=UPI002ACE6AEE|nr:hypothetical protein [Rhodopseudomonas palustris]WQH00562.1 hypothetical protein SR870_04520 [Rhodopseudomonas palustris]